MTRSPLKRKPRKKRAGDAPAYLAWLHTQPCQLWPSLLTVCAGPIEAHHAGDRGLSQRAPDRTAIPLCARHHRHGKDSAHVLGKNFWNRHGLDRDSIIKTLNERYECQIQSNFHPSR